MAIEVRQMLIKSTVVQKADGNGDADGSGARLEGLKEEILSECRRMILQMLREQQEK